MAKSPLVSLTLLADPSPPNGSPAAVAVDLPPGTSSTITADTVAAPGSYTGTSDAVVAPTSAGTNGSTILLTAMGGYVRALHLSTGTLTRAYHARELGRRVSSPVPALHSGSGTNGSLGSNSSAATAAVIASMSTSGGSYGNDLARSGNADGPGGSTASRGSGDPTGVRPAVSPCGTLVAAPGHPSERAVVVWRASSARAVPILPRGEPVPIAATMLSNGGNRASAAADTGVAGVAWCGGNDGVSPLRLVAAAVGWATAPGLGGTGGGGSAAAGLADGGIGMRARSAFCVWRVGEVRGSAGAATAASARSPGR
ncbi:hypothetical protein BC828DRAFT_379496 [Blastocladiella britannica]|nr:hypothetical protein BC828DRAFT_379496 [Blastocladiella britannica]